MKTLKLTLAAAALTICAVTGGAIAGKQLLAMLRITTNRLVRKIRRRLPGPAANMPDNGANLGITEHPEGRHHPARTPHADGLVQEIIIHAFQERRQRQWHTHTTLTGVAMAARTVGSVQFPSPRFTHNHSGYSQQQYTDYPVHCFIQSPCIFYTI